MLYCPLTTRRIRVRDGSTTFHPFNEPAILLVRFDGAAASFPSSGHIFFRFAYSVKRTDTALFDNGFIQKEQVLDIVKRANGIAFRLAMRGWKERRVVTPNCPAYRQSSVDD